MVDVARAVHHAHLHGVIHRDLKPSNILLDVQGRRLVADFGLAKRLTEVERSHDGDGRYPRHPPLHGPRAGPGPTRPDRRRGRLQPSARSSTSASPAKPPSSPTMSWPCSIRSAKSNRPRPSSLVRDMSRDLETIVLKCLDKEPSRRYATAEAMAADLENWLAGRPITARPVGQVGRTWRWCRRNPVVAGLITAVAASMVVGTAVSVGFALQARSQALAAGLSATRATILLARSDGVRPDVDDPEQASDVGFLTYARAFATAPAHPPDDLRWCIAANLAVEAQRRRPLLLDRERMSLPITAFSLSPDGRYSAEARTDGTVRIWEVPGGRVVTTIRHPGEVSEIVFSHDGSRVATCPARDVIWSNFALGLFYSEKNLNFFHTSILTDLRSTNPKEPFFLSLELPTKKSTRQENEAVRIWTVREGRLVNSLPHDEEADCMEFSHDGKRMLTFTTFIEIFGQRFTGKLLLWDISEENRSLAPKRSINVDQYSNVMLSPDGSTFALKSESGFRVFDVASGDGRFNVSGYSMIWNQSGSEIATLKTSEDATARKSELLFWDGRSGKRLDTPPIEVSKRPSDFEHGGFAPTLITYSPNGQLLAVAGTGTEDMRGGPTHYSLISRTNGQQISTGRTSVSDFSSDGRLAFLTDGQVLDVTNWQRVSPGDRRRFHPALRSVSKLGRLFLGSDAIWDLPTELSVGINKGIPSNEPYLRPDAIDLPDGLVWFENWLKLIPRDPFASDAGTIELWSELLVRKRLVGDHQTEPLTEWEWEQGRQELLGRLSASSSPLLKNLANDRGHWLREYAKEIKYQPEKLVWALDRLIEIEPRWDYRVRPVKCIW